MYSDDLNFRVTRYAFKCRGNVSLIACQASKQRLLQ